MMLEYRWPAIGLVSSLTVLACWRTPMNTTGAGGEAALGGLTDTVGNTGAAASGGSSGSGGTHGKGGTWGGTAPSCRGLAATCGPSRTDDCCTSLPVSGGTFYRNYDGVDFMDKSYPATVSDFYLDQYEVTVGRFRAFVNAGRGTHAKPPAAGAGAHPLIARTGWDSTWNSSLVANTTALQTAVQCGPTFQTWTNTAGANEDRPITCISWYEAFAFCAWDGGRLATEAEWEYAAAGGSEQRVYPWGSTAPGANANLAVCGCYYNGRGTCSGATNIAPVGSVPAGNGKWGQADLAGNIGEWVFDWYASPYIMPCTNCAATTPTSFRMVRGGGFSDFEERLRPASRLVNYPGDRGTGGGVRCAR